MTASAFPFCARAGSGIAVARNVLIAFSAPCAIVTGGIGAGGQIGVELTDFLLVLNTKEAVKTSSHSRTIKLGGNVTTAGPVGRNADASGSATFKHVSAIYSFSKTCGLFASVSLEGSVFFACGDANEKLYSERYTAKQLLNGTLPPPREADSLYHALNAKFHTVGDNTVPCISTVSKKKKLILEKTTAISPGTLRIPPARHVNGYGSPDLIAPPPPQSINDNYNQSLPPSLTSNTSYNNYNNPSSPSINNGYNNYNVPLPPSSGPYQPANPTPQHYNNKPNQHPSSPRL